MKHSPHTVQYSAEHTVATLNNAFLSFLKEMVHRVLEKKQKKSDEFMLSLLLKVLCCMEKRLHFLHTHNFLRKMLCIKYFYLPLLSSLPLFSLASWRQAKRATGTSWPDQVALARQLSGLAGAAVWSTNICYQTDILTQDSCSSNWTCMNINLYVLCEIEVCKCCVLWECGFDMFKCIFLFFCPMPYWVLFGECME